VIDSGSTGVRVGLGVVVVPSSFDLMAGDSRPAARTSPAATKRTSPWLFPARGRQPSQFSSLRVGVMTMGTDPTAARTAPRRHLVMECARRPSGAGMLGYKRGTVDRNAVLAGPRPGPQSA
jgi:hypothetical protein